MKDFGFEGNGSKFTSRFEAEAPIYAKQLNALASGIQVALPQPGVGKGVSSSYTSAGSLIQSVGDNDSGWSATMARPRQFQVRVVTDPNGQTDINLFKYTVQVANGCVTYTKSGFPYTGYAGTPPVAGGEQVVIYDYALYKENSRTEGTLSQSPWMANGGGIEIANAENGGANEWRVVLSYLDWQDQGGLFDGQWLVKHQVPWISVLPYGVGDPSDELWNWFTGNGRCMQPFYWIGYDIESSNALGPAYPSQMPYGRICLARIKWDATNMLWNIRQDTWGQQDIVTNLETMIVPDYGTVPATSIYDQVVASNFNSGYVVNRQLAFYFGAAIPGYEVNDGFWWYNVSEV